MRDEELDKIIKNKVREIKTTNYTIDDIRMLMRKGKRRRYIKNCVKFASVFVIIALSCTTIFFAFINNYNLDGNVVKNIVCNKINNNSKIVDKKYIDSFGTALTYRPEYDRRYVVRIEEIEKEELNGLHAKVYVKASVIDVIEGEYTDTINFIIDEAKVNILKYEEETEDYDTYSSYSDSKKENTYIIVTNDYNLNNKSYPEINKTYIVSLYKDSNGNLIVDNSAKYIFCEVNLDKNLVYLNDKWEQIEL